MLFFEKLILIEEFASLSVFPYAKRAEEVCVAEFDEQAEPLETYIPSEDR